MKGLTIRAMKTPFAAKLTAACFNFSQLPNIGHHDLLSTPQTETALV